LEKLKKLLILVDWFAPGYKAGGPIQSCVNICAALKDSYQIYVLTTDTDHGETKSYAGIKSNEWLYNESLGANIFYIQKPKFKAAQLAAQIKQVDADFIYLNHLFSPYFVVYPLWLKWMNKIRGKVIVCPRGALYDSALFLKYYKKKPLLNVYKWTGMHRKVTFHATNEREQEAIEKYFPGSNILVADNLPDANQKAFESCVKESGTLNCIFIARIVPIKNLLFLLQVLQQVKATLSLTIVGPIEDTAYWENCKVAIQNLPVNITVEYAGSILKNELPALIQQHHLFVLPTTGENFGHAIFEALLSGRPVLISDQTPWLQLEEKKIGWDLTLADPKKFTAVIEQLAEANQYEFDSYANASWHYARNFIDNNAAKNQYFNLFS
jgi:glycosyltransferase involved in cell wall biosynthesis